MALHLDFETRGTVDLPKQGVYNYASSEHTSVLVASYAFDQGPVQRWRPGLPYPFREYDGPIYAWNAGFERLIWEFVCTNDYGWPLIDVERFRCVAAMARMQGLPGGLDNAARALGVRNQKDLEGHRLMMKLCRPKSILPDGTPTWYEDPAEHARNEDYCDQDVRTERDIMDCLRPLTDEEWRHYHDCEHINDRGLGVDTRFAEVAASYASEENELLARRLEDLTNGDVTSTKQYQRHKDWITPRLTEDALNATLVYNKGEKKQKFDKAIRHNLLAMDDESPGFLSNDVREFTEIVHEAGRAATAKYKSMLTRSVEGRVCGAYMFSGAIQTQRYSSTGAQLHNFIRATPADPAAVREAFISGDRQEIEKHGRIIDLLAKSLRPTIRPDRGHYHAWCDWSAIEARALPWLACGPGVSNYAQSVAQDKLDTFASGEDIYVKTAASIGIDDRQIGKVAELSLGYMGGIGAFQSMARNYNVSISDQVADSIKTDWRAANPYAGELADALENAAMSALFRPEEEFHAGRVSYLYTPGTHNGLGTLWCKLPSGDIIAYPDPKIEMLEMPWGGTQEQITAIKGNWHPKQGENKWPRFKVWKGLLSENVTQATCASLQKRALTAALDRGLDVVGHTHDEILVETPDPERDGAILQDVMETEQKWAAGLPLTAEMEWGPRYKQKATQ